MQAPPSGEPRSQKPARGWAPVELAGFSYEAYYILPWMELFNIILVFLTWVKAMKTGFNPLISVAIKRKRAIKHKAEE